MIITLLMSVYNSFLDYCVLVLQAPVAADMISLPRLFSMKVLDYSKRLRAKIPAELFVREELMEGVAISAPSAPIVDSDNKRGKRRLSVQKADVASSLMKSRKSLVGLADSVTPMMAVELGRRASLRVTMRHSICGLNNAAGGFRVANEALYDYDEFVSDVNAQFSLFTGERSQIQYIKDWNLVLSGETKVQFPEPVVPIIRTCIDETKLLSKEKLANLKTAPDTQIAVEIIRLFVMDLLGRNSVASSQFLSKVESEFDVPFEVTQDAKYMTIGSLFVVNIICIAITLWQASTREYLWQAVYLGACCLHGLLMIGVFETTAVLLTYVAIPLTVADEIQHVFDIIHDLSLKISSLKLFERNEEVHRVPVLVDVPTYLFVSHKVAKQYSRLIESMVVLSYESFLPGKMSKKWDVLGENTDRTKVIWSKLYLDKLLDFIRMFGTFPVYKQSVIIKVFQTSVYLLIFGFVLLFVEYPPTAVLILVIGQVVWLFLKFFDYSHEAVHPYVNVYDEEAGSYNDYEGNFIMEEQDDSSSSGSSSEKAVSEEGTEEPFNMDEELIVLEEDSDYSIGSSEKEKVLLELHGEVVAFSDHSAGSSEQPSDSTEESPAAIRVNGQLHSNLLFNVGNNNANVNSATKQEKPYYDSQQ